MTKLAFYILLFGILCGIIAGGIVCSIALDHNPQGVYTEYPSQLLLVSLSWAGLASFPFSFIASLLEIFRVLTVRDSNPCCRREREKT